MSEIKESAINRIVNETFELFADSKNFTEEIKEECLNMKIIKFPKETFECHGKCVDFCKILIDKRLYSELTLFISKIYYSFVARSGAKGDFWKSMKYIFGYLVRGDKLDFRESVKLVHTLSHDKENYIVLRLYTLLITCVSELCKYDKLMYIIKEIETSRYFFDKIVNDEHGIFLTFMVLEACMKVENLNYINMVIDYIFNLFPNKSLINLNDNIICGAARMGNETLINKLFDLCKRETKWTSLFIGLVDGNHIDLFEKYFSELNKGLSDEYIKKTFITCVIAGNIHLVKFIMNLRNLKIGEFSDPDKRILISYSFQSNNIEVVKYILPFVGDVDWLWLYETSFSGFSLVSDHVVSSEEVVEYMFSKISDLPETYLYKNALASIKSDTRFANIMPLFSRKLAGIDLAGEMQINFSPEDVEKKKEHIIRVIELFPTIKIPDEFFTKREVIALINKGIDPSRFVFVRYYQEPFTVYYTKLRRRKRAIMNIMEKKNLLEPAKIVQSFMS